MNSFRTCNKLSQHANQRCRQRGIRQEVVELILHAGDGHCEVGDGDAALWLSRVGGHELQADGVPASVIERARGVIVLVSERDGVVRTVMHDLGQRGRPYRHGRQGPCSVRGGRRKVNKRGNHRHG